MPVEDSGPIHISKLSLAALAVRAHWLTVEWLPKYAPELYDIEVVLARPESASSRPPRLADLGALDSAIRQAVDALNHERMALRWTTHESLLRCWKYPQPDQPGA